MPPAIQYQPGQRFGDTRLRYMEEHPMDDANRRRALFQCDCGKVIATVVAWVRHNNVTSCGCRKREMVAAKNTSHGHAARGQASGAYRSWQAMHQRVLVDPRYAGRSICARWSGEDGFKNFLEDMGERPKGLTLERVDNTKGYEPGNCIWATYRTQAQNTNQVKFITMDGVTCSISEWCRLLGISYGMVKQRRQRGMSLVEALTEPLNPTKQGARRR